MSHIKRFLSLCLATWGLIGTAHAAGTATVLFKGPGIDISGKYPAERCGDYYIVVSPQKGVVYETRFEGYSLVVGDTEHRKEGLQKPLNWFVINGPKTSYGFTHGQPEQVTFTNGFKSALVKGYVYSLFKKDKYRLEVTFDCN